MPGCGWHGQRRAIPGRAGAFLIDDDPGTTDPGDIRPGSLSLRFERGLQRTAIVSRRYTWPYTVGRVFREADVPDAATVVIQSVSGTVNAGDRLAQEFLVGDGARARIRSQGAVAVHRANDGVGSHEGTRLVVASGGVIENLTEPRLLFPGADYSQQAVLDVAGGGVAIHVEAFIDSGDRYGAGRYSAPRSREAGSYASQTRIFRDGVLLAQEVSRATLPLPGEHPAHALVILAAADVEVAALDTAWSEWHDRMGTPRLYGAASALPFDAGVSVRIAAADGRLLREAVASCVAVLRTVIR